MSKVHPIPEKLWGALNYITSEVGLAIKITRSSDIKLAKANELIEEYASCFGADGRVSQRGEIPQCWNRETIFTPHRQVGNKELRYDQPLLPFNEVVEENNNEV